MISFLEIGTEMWKKIHCVSKPMIRKFVHFIAGRYYNTIVENKEKDGWVNPEIKLFYDQLGEVMSIEKEMGMWKGNEWDGKNNGVQVVEIERAKGHNQQEMLWNDLRNLVCGLLDEDSYYALRFFFLVTLMMRDRDKYIAEFRKTRPQWKTPNNRWDEFTFAELATALAAKSAANKMKKEGFEVFEDVKAHDNG